MSALLARTGRHRQRYENDFRLVAGCIPYRLKENEDNLTGDLENRLEVLMISSPNRLDLVFPKGGWEDDESVGEAACREALEEAGVRGRLDENALGVWQFRSKSKQNCHGMEGYCKGYMFALEVTEELEFWPEKSSHERRWLNVGEAFELCRYEWMRRALEAFLRYLSDECKRRTREDAVAVAVEVAEHLNLAPSCFVNASTPSASTNPINALC
ncbi:nudix hydrolase 12, mitochondrial-like [Magnolia sinica]|uniref:nudix hydrolase 12, mitochondrial-like n=1 Tax=Magnolia sinica TaxID=86752 RepID=UPI002659B8C1|nr:nudix hydrolase 12, mitochondrial-like [Magnolia sinica]XP_058092865.1 nudix hydrolase 12, mitochondrial-like [Magnolia sinica]XP_058092866.1 nudix hydrolase 12, mitochondrial-like [Magnolia sinica]XP_058092867.1 nudix hydrolase 12, mitochondrial-like [Magnolia sinica]